MSVTHQPKGSMCMACLNREKDCSDLPFHIMPVIDFVKSLPTKIVKCTHFESVNHDLQK